MWGLLLDSPWLDVWDCFGQFESEIYEIVFRQSGAKFGDCFRTVRNRNFGTALGYFGTDLGPKLVHVYCLGVIAKMNNMIGCVEIMLLMHAQLMY